MTINIPKLMGVLNITPDSFYDGGRHFSPQNALQHAASMIDEGVDIIDIGGESTRPITPFHQRTPTSKTETISPQQELDRVMPIIEGLRHHFPHIDLSIDTRRAIVAQLAEAAGVKWINYVSENFSEDMLSVLQQTSANIILCHMRGIPQNMQQQEFYQGDIVEEIIRWFQEMKQKLATNHNHPLIYLDPGIGFGKAKPDQDLEILNQVKRFKDETAAPFLIGLSRKSFIGTILKKPSSELLPATLGLNMWAMLQGADIIRVHDIAAHKDLIKIITYLRSSLR